MSHGTCLWLVADGSWLTPHRRGQLHPQMQTAFGQLVLDLPQRGFAKVADFQQLLVGPDHQVADGGDPFGLEAIGSADRKFQFGQAHVELTIQFVVDWFRNSRLGRALDRHLRPWFGILDEGVQMLAQDLGALDHRHLRRDRAVGPDLHDKLIMEIWTNGTVTPQMAVVEGAKILRKHLNPFIEYAEPGPEMPVEGPAEAAAPGEPIDHELERKLNMSLAELELSVRATNCLESEGITTVRDLVIRTDEELLEVRNFGETTLREVKNKLAERGLHLGMKLPASVRR